MTEQPPTAKPKRPSTLAVTTKVAALAVAGTLGLGSGLAWQMSQGGDPALGPKAQAAAVQPRTKIVKTTIVRRVKSPGPSAATSYTASAPSTFYPAPAPAPVATSTS